MSGSKFESTTNQYGLAVPAVMPVLNAYGALLDERVAAAESVVEVKSVKLPKVVPVRGGDFALAWIGPFSFEARSKSQAPSRFAARKLHGGQALDSFFSGEEIWKAAPDQEVGLALLEYVHDAAGVAEHEAAGSVNAGLDAEAAGDSPVRTASVLSRIVFPLSRLVALGMVVRHGGTGVRVGDLPTH